jgi:tetratricopeptide (TPR) repeat protein
MLRTVLFATILAAASLAAAPHRLVAQATPPAAVALLDSVRPHIETALVRGDWTTLDRLAARLRVASATAAGRTDPWIHYDLAYTLHRRVSGLIAEKNNARAKALVEEALRAADQARTLGAGAHARALQGALSGQMAAVGGGLSPMRFGPRALSQLDDAIEAAPNDPRVALLNGMTRLNAPSVFGGGPPRAETELRKAVRLFATDRNATPLPSWGRTDAHIWLALALQAQNKKAEARAEFDRALALTPGHRWILETLIPELERAR